MQRRLPYFVVLIATTIGPIWLLDLWHMDPGIPLSYFGDGSLYAMIVKGTMENGWFLTTNRLGAPFQFQFYDLPMAESLHFFLMKLLGHLTGSSFAALNIYYVLTFPLTGVISYYVFRKWTRSPYSAFAGSMLFTFLPYHFFRGVGHIVLSAYYIIPLIGMVILWIATGETLNRRKKIASIVICLLLSCGNVYYSFFAGFFLLVAGLLCFFRKKKIQALFQSIALILLILAGLVINFSPYLLYFHEHGRNEAIGKRYPHEAETLGLKITELVLPIAHHRIPAFANLNRYYHTPLDPNENWWSGLGLIGSVGFVYLLLFLMIGKTREPEGTRMHGLATLNLAGLLLGTVGGFGSLYAHIVSYQIRAYNRISVYIAFFSFFAIVLLLERLVELLFKRVISRSILAVLFFVFVFFGILDQTNDVMAIRANLSTEEFRSDEEFIRRIESSIPSGSMIFQLPYVKFPEGTPGSLSEYYAPLKPYLHSRSVRWSYGAPNMSEGDLWQRQMVSYSIDEMVPQLVFAGFQGIYIDRNGFADAGVYMEGELERILGTKPIVSMDRTNSFFLMESLNRKLRARYTQEEWEKTRMLALNPVLIKWSTGFHELEGTFQQNWRWCESKGTLLLTNPGSSPRKVLMRMRLATGTKETSVLSVEGLHFSKDLSLNWQEIPFTLELEVPPGSHEILFQSGAKSISGPDDPRILVFKILNFRLELASELPASQ